MDKSAEEEEEEELAVHQILLCKFPQFTMTIS